MQAVGAKETGLGQVLQRVAPPPPIKIVSDAGVKKS
jgi:ATP-binding cassette subfamily C protein